jgi:hypothetical protein
MARRTLKIMTEKGSAKFWPEPAHIRQLPFCKPQV